MRTIPSDDPIPVWRDRPALLLLAASLVLRSIAGASIGPGFDEAYYYLFAVHPAWGYFDHPPFVAATAGFGHWITGVWTPLTLRLGAILVFTLALAGFYTLAGRLYGRRAALLALVLPNATPYFFAGAGAFVLPDNALIAAWIWTLVVAQRLRERSIQRTLGFVLLGVLTGLAMLAKYHAVLLPASLVIASIYDRELRRWWIDIRLYLALLVAVLVFSPCILWNAHNGWISFAEQFGKSASGGLRLRFDLIGQAIGGQLGYLTPWVAVALWIGAFRRPRKDGADRWLLAFFLTTVVGMTLIGFTRGILPHWTMPGYVAAIVLASGAFAHGPRIRRNVTVAAAVNIALVALVVLQAQTGMLPLKPKADPTLDPFGWKQTIAELERNGDLKPGDVLFAHKWFTAAELAWADQGRHPVVLIGDAPHMFAWWAPENHYLGRSGVLITQARYRANVPTDIAPRFAGARPIDLSPLKRGREFVQMHAWRLENFALPVTPPYGPEQGKQAIPLKVTRLLLPGMTPG